MKAQRAGTELTAMSERSMRSRIWVFRILNTNLNDSTKQVTLTQASVLQIHYLTLRPSRVILTEI